MGKAWGYHLMLNVGKCRPESIRCSKNIERFTKQLVQDIDMTAFGEPQIVMFGTGDKKGYTLVQLIETSNICAHFCEETNDFYLDVFSCKPFEKMDVITCVSKYFHPTTLNQHYVERLA
jgi:S-adenosylmethionine/arginine decarboxylase-like enzyme